MNNDSRRRLGPFLVTGASSGIGRACVFALLQAGAEVFASVRRPEDVDKLRVDAGAATKLKIFLMDVTDGESILSAVERVSQALAGRGLAGLVNVAGIGHSGPLEYMPLQDLRYIYEVNVIGQLALIQAFLPAIRRVRGRIVNITSVGAHIAIPFGGALTSSKAALGSLNDSLRLELRPFGVDVIAVEPGAIHTPAAEKTLGDAEGMIAKLPAEGSARYANILRTFTRRAKAREDKGSNPSVVAAAIVRALSDAHPRTRYVVGKDAHMLVTLPRVLPDRVLDWLRSRVLGLPARALGEVRPDIHKAA